MVSKLLAVSAVAFSSVNAARPFLAYPDTALDAVVSNITTGRLPSLDAMVGLPDFDWAAQNYLPITNYTYYRNGAGGEWSYRNNLEVYNRYRFIPRQLQDITNIEASMKTTILGYEFDNPFFFSPCAKAGYGHPDAELNLVQGAAYGNIPYIVSGFATLPLSTIAATATANQTLFAQLYFTNNETSNIGLIRSAEAAGAKALVWAVDSPGSPDRQRAARFGVKSANSAFVKHTWENYKLYKNSTKLPIVLKGIQNVADLKLAIEHGVPCVILSNHGGRNLDGSPSSLEIALDIYNEDPDLFNQTEILADGGVRYGTDALRLLALGVKAVGVGRPVMFANVFGAEGIKRVVDLLRDGIMNDAANLGVGDLKTIDASYVNWTPNNWYG